MAFFAANDTLGEPCCIKLRPAATPPEETNIISFPCSWHLVINSAIAKVYFPLQPFFSGATSALPTLITARLKFIIHPVIIYFLQYAKN